MPVIPYENLNLSQVYVTMGGSILCDSGVKKYWGYDRVRLIKKFEKPEGTLRVLVQTPWGNECDIPFDYPLSETDEVCIWSPFPIRAEMKEKKVIPFDDAVNLKIFPERPSRDLNSLYVESSEKVDEKNSMQSSKKPRARLQTSTKKDDFVQAVIDFFNTPQIVANAAIKLGVPYQKIRYVILNVLKTKGFKGNRYLIISSKDAATQKLIYHIEKVVK